MLRSTSPASRLSRLLEIKISDCIDAQYRPTSSTPKRSEHGSLETWPRNRRSTCGERYRTLAVHLNMSESDKVLLLSEALSSASVTFFYSDICPASSRAGNSITDAPIQSPCLTNLSPNIRTVSGEPATLESTLCMESAQSVLKQEHEQLSLMRAETEEHLTKPLALFKLKQRIQRLFCNGSIDFRAESFMVAPFKQYLAGEE